MVFDPSTVEQSSPGPPGWQTEVSETPSIPSESSSSESVWKDSSESSLSRSKESSSDALEDPVPFHVSLSAMLVSSCRTSSLIKTFAVSTSYLPD